MGDSIHHRVPTWGGFERPWACGEELVWVLAAEQPLDVGGPPWSEGATDIAQPGASGG